jgi:diacylglycerol kinase family enzyme
MNPRYLFIINPLSGAGKGKVVAELLRRLLPTHPGFRDGKSEIVSVNELDTPEFLKLATHADAFIAVGGDGTASRLIPYMLNCDSSPALGLIPLGTSNDLARALGISVKEDYAREPGIQKALVSIQNAEMGRLDVFRVNEEVFFCNYFGIGLDAAIVRDFDRIRSKEWTRLAPLQRFMNHVFYLLTGLKNVGFFLDPAIEIGYEIEGDAHHVKLDDRCRGIIVTNLPIYAGGCRIRPDAHMDDGTFEITVVHTVGEYIGLILTRFIPFLHAPKKLSRYRAGRATIRLQAAAPCQRDGERCSEPAIMSSAFEIAFHSHIRVLAPPMSATAVSQKL